MKSVICLTILLALACADIFPNDTWTHGTIPIGKRGSDMFHIYFESRNDPANDPLVLWLTGGPGCASEVAMFFENGPYKVNDDLTLEGNPETWNNFANLLYVDQPLGTGYSKGKTLDLVSGENGVARDFGEFMDGFLAEHPELAGRDFYITGESYAGHYIPAIAYHLSYEHEVNLTLKGIAIGDGLVDPYNQYPAYATYAYENGLIGKAEYEILAAGMKVCQTAIKLNTSVVALEICNLQMEVIYDPLFPAFNPYDIRIKCAKPPLCYDFSAADNFLNSKSVEAELGVSGRKWVECSKEVHLAMLADWMLDLSWKVTEILAKDIEVLAYHGDKDFICNWRGGEAWTNAVEWPQQEAFNNATYQDWSVNGEVKGQIKEVGNLHFLKVFEAGHMVPMDQPEAALYMLRHFINNDIEISA